MLLSANNGAGLTYQWQVNGISISSATAPVYNANESGFVSVLVTDLNGCFSYSSALEVTVNPLPSVSLTPFPAYCDTLGIIALSGGTPTGGTYTGTSVNNNSFNTSISPGLYAITYSYTDANGCSDNATQNIEVIFCDYASFSESTVNYFTVYPNPTWDYFTIKSSESYVGKKFTITDMQGKHLFYSTLSEENHAVSIVHLAPGIYFLHVEGTGTYVKLVKQ